MKALVIGSIGTALVGLGGLLAHSDASFGWWAAFAGAGFVAVVAIAIEDR